MFLALLAALSTALVVPSHAQTCGREVLSYNFDEHVGAYTNWTIPKIEAAFPKQVSRPDFRGSMQQPGLVYTEGSERASVGEQQLRVFMPQVRIIGSTLCLRWSLEMWVMVKVLKCSVLGTDLPRSGAACHVACLCAQTPTACKQYSMLLGLRVSRQKP